MTPNADNRIAWWLQATTWLMMLFILAPLLVVTAMSGPTRTS